MSDPVIHDVRTSIGDPGHDDPRIVIKKEQIIPASFIEHNREVKDYQDARFAPDTLKVATIPYAVFGEYLKERGLTFADGMEIDAREILAWLRAKSMTDFTLTNRTI